MMLRLERGYGYEAVNGRGWGYGAMLDKRIPQLADPAPRRIPQLIPQLAGRAAGSMARWIPQLSPHLGIDSGIHAPSCGISSSAGPRTWIPRLIGMGWGYDVMIGKGWGYDAMIGRGWGYDATIGKGWGYKAMIRRGWGYLFASLFYRSGRPIVFRRISPPYPDQRLAKRKPALPIMARASLWLTEARASHLG